MSPRGLAGTVMCGLLWTASSSAAPPPDPRTSAPDGAVSIVPDPSDDGTKPAPLPPLPSVPLPPPPAPAPAPPAPATSPPPPPAPPPPPSPASVPPAPMTPPAVAPSPFRLGNTVMRSRKRPRPVRSAYAAAGHYVIHRDGALWRIAPEGGGRPFRAPVDLGRIAFAPSLTGAARDGQVTLWVDGRFVGGRLVVTSLAGSVPDQPRRPVRRWWPDW